MNFDCRTLFSVRGIMRHFLLKCLKLLMNTLHHWISFRGWLKRSRVVITFLMQNSNQFSHSCNYCTAAWAENDWGRNYKICHSARKWEKEEMWIIFLPLCICSTPPLWSHCGRSSHLSNIQNDQLIFIYLNFLTYPHLVDKLWIFCVQRPCVDGA